jgi:hypothetical protein
MNGRTWMSADAHRKGAEIMRRLIAVGVLLALVGCRSNMIGPFEHRDPKRVDDPHLTIGEQERNGRDRLALPEPSPTVAPPTLVTPPPGR